MRLKPVGADQAQMDLGRAGVAVLSLQPPDVLHPGPGGATTNAEGEIHVTPFLCTGWGGGTGGFKPRSCFSNPWPCPASGVT